MKKERVRCLNEYQQGNGPVVYWMSRDQRAVDNWALLYAQALAISRKEPIIVCFCLVPSFLNASTVHYEFMLNGLVEVSDILKKKQVSFFLLQGKPDKELPSFLNEHKAGALVTDFDPLRIKKKWKENISSQITIPFYEVDSHNIVPCWVASDKQEFAAYTIRPKLNRLLSEYLCNFPKLKTHPFRLKSYSNQDCPCRNVLKKLSTIKKGTAISNMTPGTNAGYQLMHYFIKRKLAIYEAQRNNPVLDGTSTLSPYLHFGQISAQRVALEIEKSDVPVTAKDAFLEELIIRRELADNFCYYNQNYDSFTGLPDWAKQTLDVHRKDKRPYCYTLEQFENAETHDPLWNAAQIEVRLTGKMHGYMRMYWAKKILEWTRDPEEALKIAVYLNDTYELDGRDPNGYTGIAWAVGGVHDRAWPERPIFGKIRFMNYNGCKRKFSVDAYIEKMKKICDSC